MNTVILASLLTLSSSLANASPRRCAQVEEALAAERLRLAHIRQCNFTAREMLGETVDRKSVICAGDSTVSRMSAAALATSPDCFDRETIQEFDRLKDSYDSQCWEISRNDSAIHSRVCVGDWNWVIPIVNRELSLVAAEHAALMRTPAGIIEAEQGRLRYLRECSPYGRAPDGICARSWSTLRDHERGFPSERLGESDRVSLGALKSEYDSLCAAFQRGLGSASDEWRRESTSGLCNADWSFLGTTARARPNRVNPGFRPPGVQDVILP